MPAHRRLQQIHALQTGDFISRGQQHDHGCAGAEKCVDENAHRLHQSDFGRMGGFCRRCRTRGGTASGFIGEKSPFDTVHQYGAEAACDCLAQTECFLKNAGKNAWKLAEVHDN